jgi:hypothetical protein
MIIESAERFGLSQLHQLRGRVGRGAEQSYCILMTSHKLSSDSKTRMETMVQTNDGFEIAEVDLKLRGPGDLMGTQQSGVLNLQIADLVRDRDTLALARNYALKLLKEDAGMQKPEHAALRSGTILVKRLFIYSLNHIKNVSSYPFSLIKNTFYFQLQVKPFVFLSVILVYYYYDLRSYIFSILIFVCTNVK